MFYKSPKFESSNTIYSWIKSLTSECLSSPEIWVKLAWYDVTQTYRRSLLGPFWITLNLIIFSAAMTVVYGSLFGKTTQEYASFIVTGMIAWTWVGSLITEGGLTFQNNSHLIRSLPIDKAQLIWASAFKHVIILGHNLIFFLLILIAGIIKPTIYTFNIIPAFFLMFALSIPLITIVSILFTRYRDLQRLVGGLLTIIMMMTPIFWKAEMLNGWRSILVLLNPMHYLIELIRAPLLGQPIELVNLIIVAIITISLWVIGSYFYFRYSRYVIFWL